MVTLSACETGMVKLKRGDEYVGMPSGFLHSGASSVISSLWAVDDLSTSLLMQRFYDKVIQNKIGKAAALRDAQQYVRHLTVKELRTEIDRLITESEKSESSEKDSKIGWFYFTQAKYSNMPDDEKPFAHPYHWGAFVCSGKWE